MDTKNEFWIHRPYFANNIYKSKKICYDVRHRNTHFMYPNTHFLDTKNEQMDTKNEQKYLAKFGYIF